MEALSNRIQLLFVCPKDLFSTHGFDDGIADKPYTSRLHAPKKIKIADKLSFANTDSKIGESSVAGPQ